MMTNAEIQATLDTYQVTPEIVDGAVVLTAPEWAPAMPDGVKASLLAALAARRSTATEEPIEQPVEQVVDGLSTDVLEGHLMTLYCRLLDACDEGLLLKAQRVPDDMMPILHTAFAPDTSDERRARTITRAGDAALAAYVLHEYRGRIALLEQRGRDAFEWKALLGVVLAEAEARPSAAAAGSAAR